tara:strand:+ start:4321 stop:5082 length:762 start_codon:yes stop_codon:yes gene_type:complete
MKIAVCLFGQPRDFDISSRSIVNFFDSIGEIDYFIHTWNGKSYSHNSENATIEVLDLDLIKEEILTAYKPIKVDVDEYSILDCYLSDFMYQYKTLFGESVDSNWKVYNIVGMYYSIEKVQSMRCEYELENSFEYDLVFNMRLDSNMWKRVSVDYFDRIKKNIMEQKPNNLLYVESLNLNKGDVCMEDHWFISDSRGLKVFTTNLVDNLIFISKEKFRGQWIHNEVIFGMNAINTKITVNRLNLPHCLTRDYII